MLVLLDEAGCPVAKRAGLWDRLMARVQAPRLDSDLARGVSPDATIALALRARALVRPQTRRELAFGARRLLAASARPSGLRVPVCRDRVRESSEEFADLIGRLVGNGPVAVRGVALASVLLCDGNGPLYRRANQDDTRARVREAATAMDPLAD
jgi:hypothetical protein